MCRILDDYMEHVVLVIEIAVLVGISALCSGLNVAFMALDPQGLKRKAKLGDRAAKRVLPLRRKSHLTLSAILLANVGAVSATSLVLEHHFYGLIAGLITTLLIVIFGEIVPQAFFVRRALTFVSLFAPVLRFMIIVTYPISKPLQLLLDKMFARETAHLQSRHEIGMMISEHLGAKESDLDEDEIEIIRGALQLSEKKVASIMTPMKSVFWLQPQDIIDSKRIDEIKASGKSRIPVLNAAKTICFGVLLVKDLLDIDFDDYQPRVDDLYLHPIQAVGAGTALDTMFRKFITAKTHLMPIEKDDQVVGIVTIEDLIEEILGHEIEDETDHLQPQNKKK